MGLRPGRRRRKGIEEAVLAQDGKEADAGAVARTGRIGSWHPGEDAVIGAVEASSGRVRTPTSALNTTLLSLLSFRELGTVGAGAGAPFYRHSVAAATAIVGPI